VLLGYGTALALGTQRPGGALSFAVLGTSNTPGNRGYDGQYYYRIARDPLGGTYGLDKPAYRYQRIGYPLLAWLAALDRRERIAAALVLVNAAAIAVGVLLVALLLRRNGASPLYALPFALYAGQVGSFWRDLAEPTAFALVAWALLLLRPDRTWPAALALLAAALTKETALLFALALALHYAVRARWRALGTVVALVALPYALWQLILWLTLGQTGVAGADHPRMLPLGGLTGVRGAHQLIFDLLAVVLPAALCLVLTWKGMRRVWLEARRSSASEGGQPSTSPAIAVSGGRGASRGYPSAAATRGVHLPTSASMSVTIKRWWAATLAVAGDLPTLLLLVNLAFVLWLPARSYADLWASARNAQGLVLAALFSPALASTRLRWPLCVLWGCCAPLLWLQ
jgi:hypothetical protein